MGNKSSLTLILLILLLTIVIGFIGTLRAEEGYIGKTIEFPPDAPRRVPGETDAERARKLLDWLSKNPEIAKCTADRLAKDASGKLICKEPTKSSSPEAPITYRDRFMPEGVRELDAQGRQGQGGTYQQDVNIWVYSQKFAARFGMPEQWIDDALKGAQAIAYRNIWLPGADCSVRNNACNPRQRSYIDVYVDSDAPLPWIAQASEKAYRFPCWSADSSCFLTPQQESDRARKFNFPRIFSGLGYWRIKGKDISYSLEMNVTSIDVDFQHNLYPGIDFVSLLLAGFENRFYQDGLTLMFFRNVDSSPKPSDLDSFLAWRKKAVVHEIEIPASFMQRVRRYDDAWMQMNRELYKEVSPRLFPWPPAKAARGEELKK